MKTFFILFAALFLQSCSNHDRSNPVDPDGANWNPPTVAVMEDTTVAVYDSFYIHAEGCSRGKKINCYIWEFPEDSSFTRDTLGTTRDTTKTGMLKIAFVGPGKAKARVWAVDEDGYLSGWEKNEKYHTGDTLEPYYNTAGVISINVHLFAPTVFAMKDTNVNINDSIEIEAEGVDTNGTIKKYLWAKDGINFKDTTTDGIYKTAWSDSGEIVVLVSAMDDDQIKSKPDTCIVTVTLDPPLVVAMNDTTISINDSLIVRASGIDNNSVEKYIWANNNKNYSDTTINGLLLVTYSDTGRKTILVKVVDDDDIVSKQDTCVVNVLLNPPVVIAMQDTTVAINDDFTIHAEGNDTNGEVERYLWAIDGIHFIDTTEKGLIQTGFKTSGEKIVLVRAVDDDGIESFTDSIIILVALYPPLLNVMQDTTVAINDTFYLHAEGSDQNGAVKKYLWALDGINFKDSTDNGYIQACFSFTGEMVVSVKVIDDDEQESIAHSLNVTVEKYIPLINSMQDTVVAINESFLVHASGIDINGTIQKYFWALDGLNFLDSSNTGEIAVVYNSEGTQYILVKVRDDDMFESMVDTVKVTVSHNQPVNLYPPDGESLIDVRPTLRWIPGLYASSFTVKLDSVNPPITVIAAGVKDSFYIPEKVLNNLQTYYWQITAINSVGQDVSSDISRFIPGKWRDLGGGVNGDVNALCFDAFGNLYIGGYFTTAGGKQANRIAKWNGSSWSSLGAGMDDGQVYAIACDQSGNLFAGGSFTLTGGKQANRIAMWNGSTWSALGSGMDKYVNALAVDASGNLYAGGVFSTAGGKQVNNIAKWNGGTWTSLENGMDSVVQTLAMGSSGNLYAGGNFSTAGGKLANKIAMWNGNTWSCLGSGVNSRIWALSVDASGNLYVGGDFNTVDGMPISGIAKWDGTAWSSTGDDYSRVRQLTCDKQGNLYMSNGGFQIIKINEFSKSTLGGATNDNIYILACDVRGDLYVGGDFTKAGDISAKYITVLRIE